LLEEPEFDEPVELFDVIAGGAGNDPGAAGITSVRVLPSL
jgi:hypothetical protein